MPELKNVKREKFAQNLALGKTQAEAYELAGYTPNPGNAGVLAKRKEIQERIVEINKNAGKLVEISIARVLAELGKIGFANMEDYVTIGSDGLPFVDMSNVDRDKMAAVQEVIVETKVESEINEEGEREAVPVRKVRFKLADKRAALVEIGRHFGMFIDKTEHSGTIDLGLGDRLDSGLLRLERRAENKYETQH